jgi:F-type H+-transporting ATPase subunit epsilon
MNKVNIKIVTPKQEMFNGTADMAIFRTKSGDIGVMHGHIPLVTVLDYGVLRIIDNNETVKSATIFGGYAEIDKESVTVLTDASEWTDEIDVQRATEARDRAEKRLNGNTSDIDELRAELALKRAVIRIDAANK